MRFSLICAWLMAAALAWNPLVAQQQIVLFPGIEGQALLDSLVKYYKPQTVLNYDDARDTLFARVYALHDSLTCVYTGFKIFLDPAQDPSTDAFNKGINTEHTWPQSKGAVGNAKSDMHHLYPVKDNVNSSRSNSPFDEIPDPLTDLWYRTDQVLTTIPNSFIDQYSEKDNEGPRFEPREDHKGNVARAMFYFYTMYKTEALNADSAFFDLQKNVLFNWHYLDPVDSLEYVRTQLIATYQQGKANPFVLDSTLVRRAYFSGSSPPPDSSGYKAQPGDVIITEIMKDPATVPDTDGEWFEIFNTTGQSINIDGWTIKDNDLDSHVISNGGSLIIPPKGFLVLGRNSNSSANGGVPVDYQYSSFQLANGADEIVLIKNDGVTEIDRIEYDGGTSWPSPTGASFAFSGHWWEENNNPSQWVVSGEPWPGSAGDLGSPGYSGADQSLPVTLSSFTAYVAQNYIELRWATESEINNLGFEVYRALSGDSLQLYASYQNNPLLLSRGNSNRKQKYSFRDANVVRGRTYTYRLADVDMEGRRTFHKPISVSFTGSSKFLYQSSEETEQFQLSPGFPNPFNQTVQFKISIPPGKTPEQKIRISIYDTFGRMVKRLFEGGVRNGEYVFSWDGRNERGSSASSGVYFIHFQNEFFAKTEKITLLK